jgi:hypothetical protein
LNECIETPDLERVATVYELLELQYEPVTCPQILWRHCFDACGQGHQVPMTTLEKYCPMYCLPSSDLLCYSEPYLCGLLRHSSETAWCVIVFHAAAYVGRSRQGTCNALVKGAVIDDSGDPKEFRDSEYAHITAASWVVAPFSKVPVL